MTVSVVESLGILYASFARLVVGHSIPVPVDFYWQVSILISPDLSNDPIMSSSGKTPEEFATQGRFKYPPSFAASVIFTVIYGVAMVVNLAQMFRHRAWFWWVMNLAVASKCSKVKWFSLVDPGASMPRSVLT